MIAVLFLGFIFFALWFLKILLFERAKHEPPRHRTFNAAIKYGELQVMVQYESSPENPTAPSVECMMERTIRLWAMEREDRENSPELHLALEWELRRHFPEAEISVISLKVIADPEPPEIVAQVSRAEWVKAELLSDADTVQEIGDTLNDLRDSRKDLWSNLYPGSKRPIGEHLDEKADSLIRDVLHGPKRRR